MWNIIKSELFKLSRNKVILICAILAMLLALSSAILMMVIANEVAKQIIDIGELAESLDYLSNPGLQTSLWVVFSDSTNYILIVASIACSVIVVDFQRGIIRNMITAGHSRYKVYFAKQIVMIMVGAAFILCVCALTLSINAIRFGTNDNVSAGRFFAHFLLSFLAFVATVSVITFVAFLTKNTAATIGINIGIVIFFAILSVVSVFTMSDSLKTINKVVEFVSELYVGNLISASANFALSSGKIVKYLCTSLITIGATWGLGGYLFTESDLK